MGGGISSGHEIGDGPPAFLISQHHRKPELKKSSNPINLTKNCSLKFDKNPTIKQRWNGWVSNCLCVSGGFGRFNSNVPC